MEIFNYSIRFKSGGPRIPGDIIADTIDDLQRLSYPNVLQDMFWRTVPNHSINLCSIDRMSKDRILKIINQIVVEMPAFARHHSEEFDRFLFNAVDKTGSCEDVSELLKHGDDKNSDLFQYRVDALIQGPVVGKSKAKKTFGNRLYDFLDWKANALDIDLPIRDNNSQTRPASLKELEEALRVLPTDELEKHVEHVYAGDDHIASLLIFEEMAARGRGIYALKMSVANTSQANHLFDVFQIVMFLLKHIDILKIAPPNDDDKKVALHILARVLAKANLIGTKQLAQLQNPHKRKTKKKRRRRL